MKFYKIPIILLLTCFVFSCAPNTYRLEKQSPLKFHKIEVQKWTLDSKHSGIRMLIVLPSDINTRLVNAYYDNLKADIYKGKNKNSYFADFVINAYQKPFEGLPFVLKENECLISYNENGRTKYLKYSNVKIMGK